MDRYTKTVQRIVKDLKDLYIDKEFTSLWQFNEIHNQIQLTEEHLENIEKGHIYLELNIEDFGVEIGISIEKDEEEICLSVDMIVPADMEEIYTFSEAQVIWGLSESTLRKQVERKGFGSLVKGVDYKKSGGTWLISRTAMINTYGVPYYRELDDKFEELYGKYGASVDFVYTTDCYGNSYFYLDGVDKENYEEYSKDMSLITDLAKKYLYVNGYGDDELEEWC